MKSLERRLSISIINFNSGEYLLRCLESLKKIKGEVDMEIYVSDNASTDGSFKGLNKSYPEVHFSENHENLGFTKAHNILLKEFKTEYILILNPDTEITEGTLRYMLDFMDKNPEVGAVTCRIEKSDGTIDWASHRGFPTPWASFLYYFFKDDSLYHLTSKDLESVHEVDSITGAFFLTRKSVLDKVGLFDESFFMYGEDLDLCFRIKQKGFNIMYVPDVKVIHHKGISSGIKKHSQEITKATRESKIASINYFYGAMIIFYKKHLAKKYPFFINWLVYLGINLKWFLAKRKLTV